METLNTDNLTEAQRRSGWFRVCGEHDLDFLTQNGWDLVQAFKVTALLCGCFFSYQIGRGWWENDHAVDRDTVAWLSSMFWPVSAPVWLVVSVFAWARRKGRESVMPRARTENRTRREG